MIRVRARAQQEQQAELAHLNLVAAAQLGFLDPLAIHVGAVEAAHVADREPARVPVELGMPAGDRHVVKEDVALRVAASGGEIAVEQEPAPGVRPAADHQQRGAGRERGYGSRVGAGIVAELGLGKLGVDGGDYRRRLSAALAGAIGQRGTAVRAETSPCGIRPAAPGAVDARHLLAEPPLRPPGEAPAWLVPRPGSRAAAPGSLGPRGTDRGALPSLPPHLAAPPTIRRLRRMTAIVSCRGRFAPALGSSQSPVHAQWPALSTTAAHSSSRACAASSSLPSAHRWVTASAGSGSARIQPLLGSITRMPSVVSVSRSPAASATVRMTLPLAAHGVGM